VDLKEPKKAYLELADQPANNIPYTYVVFFYLVK
jgi:hypothetical protein